MAAMIRCSTAVLIVVTLAACSKGGAKPAVPAPPPPADVEDAEAPAAPAPDEAADDQAGRSSELDEGRLGPKPEPTLLLGAIAVVGDYSKDSIRTFVEQQSAKLLHCYQQELAVHAGLEGTVTAQFFISPTGSVMSANASGVSAEVSTCVANVLRGIEYPKPRGGGGVQVSYPLVFAPGG